jgi:hypothetical protein
MSENWAAYAEAVAALARVPELAAERRRIIAAEEQAAVAHARSALDNEIRHCDEWAAAARRAVTNAEAHLVAAHVLIPDGSAEPAAGSPAGLADNLHAIEDELGANLRRLTDARRRAAHTEAAAEARRAARAVRRRQLLTYAALAATLLALLLLGYLTAR